MKLLGSHGHNLVGALVCFSFALFFSLYNFLPLLDAKWSLIDDHEIFWAIGQSDKLPIADLPNALRKTELGDPASLPRFRPSYYLLRFTEAAAWGKQPRSWYATRVVIASLCALVLTGVCLRVGGPILTFGFIAFELSRPYWSGTFARLGPAEIYAAAGLCLIVLGFSTPGWRRGSSLASASIALGVIIAGGSKENFLFLGVLPVWLLASKTVRLPVGARVLFLGVLGYLAWIAVSLAIRLGIAGQTLYSQDISVGSRLKLLATLLTLPEVQAWLIGCACLVVVIALLQISNRDDDNQRTRLVTSLSDSAVTILLLLAVFATQYIFYFGDWPEGAQAHYLFPGLLAEHMAVFVAAAAFAKLVTFGTPRLCWASLAPIGIAVCFLMVTAGDRKANRRISEAWVAASAAFTSKLNETLAYLKESPSATLVLNSHHAWDWEPVMSLEHFVRAAGLSNPVTVRLDNYSPETFRAIPLFFRLTTDLAKLQAVGGNGFSPWQEGNSITECFSVGFSGPPLATCAKGLSMKMSFPK